MRSEIPAALVVLYKSHVGTIVIWLFVIFFAVFSAAGPLPSVAGTIAVGVGLPIIWMRALEGQ